ncbi:GtrA family protein [Candidatus Parcubacteria bacterium]|nr:MAG: GtrA family protein [Candidatus Parcubacteria bacterium]
MNINVHKNDLIAAAVIGEVVAWLVIATNANLQIPIPYFNIAIPIVFPALSAFGMYIAEWLSAKWAVLTQLAKFALVGALNTFIDLGLLNLLIFASAIAAGKVFLGFKAIAFTAAVINSYFWNKFWTFKAGDTHAMAGSNVPEHEHHGKEFFQFLVVSIIGLLINVAVAGFVVNVLGPQGGLRVEVWANVGAIIATFAALVWNFLGYKFIVFKR